ncbi:MAG: transporter, partial [Alphaproteobacteria bacterium]
MLALNTFRGTEPGVADLLPWATLMDDGLVINKDGSLMAGWLFKGPDVASLTPAMKNAITRHLNNTGLLGDGFAFWIETVRMPAADYPRAEHSHFPDPVSAAIDEERRRQFLAEGAHYETGQAVILVYRPPIRHQSRIISSLYSGGGEAAPVGDQQVEIFQRACQQLEDILGDVLLNFRRMGALRFVDRNGREHHQDELVNFLYRCLTGDENGLNIPPCAMHLDAIIGGQELWTGDMLKLGERFIACVSIEGFPAESYPFILDALSDLPFAYRFSSRFILLSGPEGKRELGRIRRKWRQRIRGLVAQVFRTSDGWINEDAALMARQAEAALSDAESGLLAYGYYTPVIELRGENLAALSESARLLVRTLARLGFAARIETVNTVEAFLGTLPGHVLPNVRRPLIHSLNFADLLPVSSPYTGQPVNPSPLFPPNSPPLAVVATGGATPFYYNIHQGD